ncbi:PEP-CTERM motif protein [Thalassoglobus neptunius]|uniref:PEP-CTERM motif protein n=1 Tax=Thalassoglobus neptunius TaxID=1938619 RepID=A0A5C5WGY4_9PLAN|nr:PEP-CTERM sorting domain-containing protein [Thalassoglobus neptunius]TWT50038.1 PEP-CTERM motif protein [Thalassoglobus neptunius]
MGRYLGAFCATLVVAGLGASSAKADFLIGGTANFGSDPAEVTVKIEDLGGSLKFTITSIPAPGTGNIGDLQGFFFDVNDSSLLSGLSVTGADVTGSDFSGSTRNLGNGVNLNGDGNYNFDAGVKIGTSGMGTDDIQTTSFVLSHSTQSLDLSLVTSPSYFGVRLTSVGPVDGSRGGSSKLKGPGDPFLTTVPEPSSFALLGLGSIGMARLARRRRSN